MIGESKLKKLIKSIPIIGAIASDIYKIFLYPRKPFIGSTNYWIERYDFGGNSGCGSYNQFAEFKADVINQFVQQNDIKTIIEYGCGDGNQLKLAAYPSYVGFDISHKAISICRETFPEDITKTFKMMNDYTNETAELTLCLDVIYHLVEDGVYVEFMNRLFDSSERFVIIYPSDSDIPVQSHVPHVKHRNFTRWVDTLKPEWKLTKHIPNKYPYTGDAKTGSSAEFFIYERKTIYSHSQKPT